jgi:predicted homoserine dehydrogenase-like protein
MSLQQKLAARVAAGKPVRVGLVGAGKFGSMFLAQVPSIPGLEVTVISETSVERGKQACRNVGWDETRIARTKFSDRGRDACLDDSVEVVVEATGNPAAGIAHAIRAIDAGKHIVMANVEADCLAGWLLAARARAKGVVYSMAYGDQPALVCEMVDWARSAGFTVAAAGKGTKYLPLYHSVTPDDVWRHYGLSEDEAKAAGMNPQMFNSFLDGTKSAIEMAAIANACRLEVPRDGLTFPPCGVDSLAHVLRPHQIGGQLERDGMVEVVSSLERNGETVPRDLRWGVYVVLKAPNDYAASCFKQYGLPTDSTGRYAAMYKPFHLIGLELSISILNAALRGEATGTSLEWRGDAVTVAKRALKAGEILDGEGGYTVYGKLVPSQRSLADGALPIGLAHKIELKNAIPAGGLVRWSDVTVDPDVQVVKIRREAEAVGAGAAP